MGVVERHPNADVLIENDKIVAVGKHLESEVAEIIDVSGKVIVPGFVDPHTHLVWSGSREHELEWKLQGRTYQEILANGGGILRTVKETQNSKEEELQQESLIRFKNAIRSGSTTIEIKSGYGLEEETELKQLRVANWLGNLGLAETVVTFMGAHALPEGEDRRSYISFVCSMLPEIRELADFCDNIRSDLGGQVPKILESLEKHVINLAADIAMKIVADLPIDKTMVERVVKDALAKAEKEAEIVVLLHPEDLDLLTQGDSELLDESHGAGEVLFKASSEVTRGGCLLDTHYGIVDARRETKADLLKQAVTV